MENTLLIIFISLALATVLNIIFKKFSISHIIGYIITGTIVTTIFDLNNNLDMKSLDLIAEFGASCYLRITKIQFIFTKIVKVSKCQNVH